MTKRIVTDGVGAGRYLPIDATRRWIMTRQNDKSMKVRKLKRDVVELERQLKQHPLGSIILKSRIKQKQIEINDLNYKKIGRGKDRRKKFVIRVEDK